MTRQLLSYQIFLVLLLFGAFGSLDAQNLPVSPDLGTHFLIPIPDTVDNKNGNTRITLTSRYEILLVAPEGSDVTLEGPTGMTRSVSLLPGKTTVVSVYDLFPPQLPVPLDPPGYRDPRVVSVTGTRPLWVTLRIVNAFGSETFRPLPVAAWGQAYRLTSMRSWILQSIGVDPETLEEGFEIKDVYPFAVVVAAEDTTRVTLAAAIPTVGPRTFILNAGEAYSIPIRERLDALDTAARDLTANLVSADKPIAVMSGNTRSYGGAPIGLITELPGNSLQNLLVEWLPPISRLGTSFVYTPVMVERDTAVEVIRIIPSEPGVTTISTSLGGPPMTVVPGEFIELRSPGPMTGPQKSSFAISSDKKILVSVVTGAEGIFSPNNNAGAGYGSLESWGPALTLLQPTEEWGDIVYAYGHPRPAGMTEQAVLVAEPGAVIAIDGVPVPLESIAGAPFLTGRVDLSDGDHEIRSIGGRFSAIGYGITPGFEAYLVPGTKDGDGKERTSAHITEYQENLSIAWAAILPGGRLDGTSPPDSITISTRDYCDSTTFAIDRISDNIWSDGPLDISLLDGINSRIIVDTIAPLGPVTGYRVRAVPIDLRRDASGRIVVRGVGITKESSYLYRAQMVTLPIEIDFGVGIPAGVEQRRRITLENVRSFTGTVIDGEVESGATGFGLDDGGRLPRPLRSGESVDVEVTFTGRAPSITWLDTLLITTDCGTYRVPLRARTSADPPQRSLPTITGYDWALRGVGTTHDTLSFAGNDGTQSYTIAEVSIIGGASSAFSLIPPREASDVVATGDQLPLGIRFAPTAPGSYLDTILLVSTDGDSARALLRGVAIDTAVRFTFSVDTLSLDTLCLGDTITVDLRLRNNGTNPVPFGEVVPIRTNDLLLVGVRWPEGMTIPAGGEIFVEIRMIATRSGVVDLLLGFNPLGAAEGEVAELTAEVTICEPPALEVTDHDFGEIWITTSRDGEVFLQNSGRGDITIYDGTLLNDGEGSFEMLEDPFPILLPEGDARPIALRFRPMTVGEKQARIAFETSVGPKVSELIGRGKRLVVPAYIRRDYTAPPGTEVIVGIDIERPADSVFPDHIDYRLSFADDLLDFIGLLETSGVGTPQLGLGEITGRVSRSAADSLGAMRLLNVRFLVRLSLIESTELPFTLTSDLPWLDFEERPGLFTREAICALENRLFDFTRFGVEIGFPEPNPSREEANFSFEIPFEARTTVVLYDLLGHEVGRLLDEVVLPGAYTLLIPSSDLPVGTYILRFRSGTITGTRRVDVVR